MAQQSEVTLLEDSEALRARFPDMNCFRIKVDQETVGRCVGFVCPDQGRFQGWIDEQRDFEVIPSVHHMQLPIGILEEVVVFEQFRGKGYSKPATDQFLKWFEEQGCLHVILNAVPQGKCRVDLVRLYERSGFHVICDSGLGKFMVRTRNQGA